jgi:hypothetical protein
MNTLEHVRNAKLELRLEICELQAKVRELATQLKELDEVEAMLFEREVGVTKCPIHDFNQPKSRKGKGKPKDSILTKFQTLSKEEQANLLNLLGGIEENENETKTKTKNKE